VFAFGLGYCARHLASGQPDWAFAGTTRDRQAANGFRSNGLDAYVFSGAIVDDGLRGRLREADTVLVSIPPDESGDPTLRQFSEDLVESAKLRNVVYLSTVGVYGNSDGAWVDERSERKATSLRGCQRVRAEDAWISLAAQASWRLDILRLAGIYGPGRNPLEKLRLGQARSIAKPAQVFNRAHVDDIARMIALVLEARGEGEVWNVADDEPAPPQDVIAYAAALLGKPAPQVEDFATADLTGLARSFYADNRRVSIGKAKSKLGFAPLYPTYREGLAALAGP
jgi:nucleoside-diphosphate-sugar epimerase